MNRHARLHTRDDPESGNSRSRRRTKSFSESSTGSSRRASVSPYMQAGLPLPHVRRNSEANHAPRVKICGFGPETSIPQFTTVSPIPPLAQQPPSSRFSTLDLLAMTFPTADGCGSNQASPQESNSGLPSISEMYPDAFASFSPIASSLFLKSGGSHTHQLDVEPQMGPNGIGSPFYSSDEGSTSSDPSSFAPSTANSSVPSSVGSKMPDFGQFSIPSTGHVRAATYPFASIMSPASNASYYHSPTLTTSELDRSSVLDEHFADLLRMAETTPQLTAWGTSQVDYSPSYANCVPLPLPAIAASPAAPAPVKPQAVDRYALYPSIPISSPPSRSVHHDSSEMAPVAFSAPPFSWAVQHSMHNSMHSSMSGSMTSEASSRSNCLGLIDMAPASASSSATTAGVRSSTSHPFYPTTAIDATNWFSDSTIMGGDYLHDS